MLDDISAVKSWDKVNSGMIKMYHAEVLGKLPVIQHFLFGSILPYTGPPPSSSPTPTPTASSSIPMGAAGLVATGANGPVGPDDPHWGHAHAHPGADLGGAGQREVGWGDCCGIPVPSAFAAAQADKQKEHGLRIVGQGIRPVPFD